MAKDAALGRLFGKAAAFFRGPVEQVDGVWTRKLSKPQLEDISNNFPAYRVDLPDGTSRLYKLNPDMDIGYGVPANKMINREVGASITDRHLGFGLVPRTTFWEGPYGKGSLQDWLHDATPGKLPHEYDRLDQQRMAVLDYVMGSGDRNIGNVFTHHGRPAATDNSISFPRYDDEVIRSTYVKNHVGQQLDADVLAQVNAVDPVRLATDLKDAGIDAQSVTNAMSRLREIQSNGAITGRYWRGDIIEW
ncbi:hypothetical protein [Actinoallomurus iriomotensis]|uniref:PI3K/PI4K catalytic domain-containing protein n=1 Tax=Actinoallomurus iriomotensis TaxID=478107 RepID=A0A9W6RNE0_9ACTN|nr:hypothetical protein [Actinoallomurus iriomotensis]GLY78919.1 hypothetical protein Airi01_071860 [Actinoallomurus iriomotensis]